jgi:hypothetical protein
MIRKMLAAATMVAALSVTGAHAGAIDVCTNNGGAPGNGGGVTVSEGGATVTWGGASGGQGGAHQCLHVDHP